MTPQDAQPSDRGPIPPDADDDDLTDDAVERMLQAGAGAGTMQAKWQPPPPEAIERLLPDYEIHEMIGFGGMGVVYRGVQRCLERVVAIKILAPEIARSDPQFVARFKNEARAMARLPHPRVVAVHDFGEAVPPIGDSDAPGGLLYIVMEFIDGTDLARVMAAEGRIPFPRAAVIAAQVCEALEFSHRHGIIHRDVKPSNVLIDREGGVKVADFGLAKETARDGKALTSSKIVMGTRRYMSPEQAKGGTIDHRTDIYSTGAMLYEMLTGETPHGAFEPPSLHVQLAAHVDEVVLRALARDPARRYESASELRAEILRIANAPPPTAGPVSRAMSRAGVVALLAAATALTLGVSFLRRVSESGPVTAEAASDAESARGDVDRECAKLAVEAGAQIGVRTAAGSAFTVLPGGKLPSGDFTLVSVRFEKPVPATSQLPSSMIVNLARARSLEVLSFYQVKPEFSDATFAAFGTLPHLRELNANNPYIEDAWLRHLSRSTSLSLLRLPGSGISDAGVAHLAPIPGLKELDLSKAPLTGAALAKLSCKDTLIQLNFGHAGRQLAGEDFDALAGRFGKLERLTLSGPVDGAALRRLEGMKQLRILVFSSGQKLTAAHFRALENMSARHVIIVNTTVADDAWDALADLRQVDTVQFTNMRWPAACEQALGRMTSLRKIILADGPAEDVTRASAALPRVLVEKIGYDPRTRFAPPPPTSGAAAPSQMPASLPPLVEMPPGRHAEWDALVRKHEAWQAKIKADPSLPAFALNADAHRLIAERMLTLGGRPTLTMADGHLLSRVPGQDLPAGEWTVSALDFEMPVRKRELLTKPELMLMLAIPESEGLVTYSVQPEIDADVLRQLGRHHGLRWLGIRDVPLKDEWLVAFEPCDRLQAFCLSNTGIGDDGLSHVKHHREIKNLEVPHTNVTGEAIARLACAPTLDYVFFGKKGREVGADIRAVIRACPQLIILHASGQFSGSDFAEITSLKRLQTLSLGESQISADVIDALAVAGVPRQLKLGNCQLDDAAWQSVKKLSHLRTLTYQGDRWPEAASAALRSLRTLSQLELIDNARSLAPQVRAAVPGLFVVTN